jgi:hypothetical protein
MLQLNEYPPILAHLRRWVKDTSTSTPSIAASANREISQNEPPKQCRLVPNCNFFHSFSAFFQGENADKQVFLKNILFFT